MSEVRSATGFDRLTPEERVKFKVNAQLAYTLGFLTSDSDISHEALKVAAAALGKGDRLDSIIVYANNCIRRAMDQVNTVGAGQNDHTFPPELAKDLASHTIGWTGSSPYASAFDTTNHIGAPWLVVRYEDLAKATLLYATPGDLPPLMSSLRSLLTKVRDAARNKVNADPELVRLLELCQEDVTGGKHTSLATVVAALVRPTNSVDRYTESAAYMIDLVAIHTVATVNRLIDAIPASDAKTGYTDKLRSLFKVVVGAYKRNEDQAQGTLDWRYHKLPSKYYVASVMLDVLSDLQSSMPLSDVVDRLLSVIAVDFSNVVTHSKYPIDQFKDGGSLSEKAARLRARVSEALKGDRGKGQLVEQLVGAIWNPKDPTWWAVNDFGRNEDLNAAVKGVLGKAR
jgi:hypothetical protein